MGIRNVLLVEDDPFWEKMMAHSLKSMKADVTLDCVRTAEEAQQLVQTKAHYDLIISDHFLGGTQTGLDLWEGCQFTGGHIPFILTSGLAKWDLTKNGPNVKHMPPYLAKPFSVNDLHRLVQIEMTLAALQKEALIPKSRFTLSDALVIGAVSTGVALTLLQLFKMPTQREIKGIIESIHQHQTIMRDSEQTDEDGYLYK